MNGVCAHPMRDNEKTECGRTRPLNLHYEYDRDYLKGLGLRFCKNCERTLNSKGAY
jgi:hypothetical protein